MGTLATVRESIHSEAEIETLLEAAVIVLRSCIFFCKSRDSCVRSCSWTAELESKDGRGSAILLDSGADSPGDRHDVSFVV